MNERQRSLWSVVQRNWIWLVTVLAAGAVLAIYGAYFVY